MRAFATMVFAVLAVSLLAAPEGVVAADRCAALGQPVRGGKGLDRLYCAAIAEGCLIKLTYEGDLPNQPRLMRPYGVGESMRNNVLLFGEQISGYSKSAQAGRSDLPGWRNFNLEKIVEASFVSGDAPFHAPARTEYRGIRRFDCKDPEMAAIAASLGAS